MTYAYLRGDLARTIGPIMSTALQALQDAQAWLSRAEQEAGMAETMPELAKAHQACAEASEAVAASHRALVKEYASA